ncbi:hypothetical protein N7508_009572 [Penicillium antarcticum]|uniref:uncharacterized protein n=1 Tax=Penicillium antarcticum TaxID=416450 RepID=UPI00239194E7|nr:uncharacterized protein N7508_009572 [Penicillium antarcticum]KAJ5294751.1 hypothetical protein N7508_009572 [Penicillium antarcticum]
MNKNVIKAKDFTLQESADSSHLAALAKHFEGTGKNLSVSAVLDPPTAWAWKSGDYKTTKWRPQGITSSADAFGKGDWNNHKAWIVSWYQTGDSVRVSFVDRKTNKYRHALLVYPSADDDFKSITIHAGGIMWYGNLLYVVDTNNGIRAFDLDNIWEVDIADGVGKNEKGYSADGYRYVLPQIRDSPDTLLVGEFVRDGEVDKNRDPVPIRLVKYQLDSTTRRLRTDDKGLATASWAHCVDILKVQGAVSYDDKFYLSRSNGRNPKAGDLFTWKEGKTAKEYPGWFMAGNEDLSYNPVRKEYYTVTEYDGGRYILSYKA